MPQLSRLTSEDRGNLVAYLDGELDEATSDRIDRTVAENEVARREVELFERVYDLLDHLPEAKVSTEFTQSTIAAVRQQTEDVEGSAGRLQNLGYQLRPLVVLAAVSALSTALGVLLGAAAFRSPVEDRLELVPVADHLETLEAVGDLTFLERLHAQKSLVQELRSRAPQPSQPLGSR